MKTTILLIASTMVFAASCPSASAADTTAPALEDNANRNAINAMQGQPAPALAVGGWINSNPLTLADLKGKIVVIDFWATWCGPCLASIPHNNALQKKYVGQVVFIGVCAPRGGEKLAATVSQRGIEYAVALDNGKKGDTFAAYQADSYPDYYIIDRKGNLHWGDIVNGDVEKAIRLLLAQKD